jgi:hypothetical protein
LPPAPEYPIRTISIFFENSRDIRKSRCTTGINDTGRKFATSFTSVVDTDGEFATGVKNTGGKFAAGVNNTGGKYGNNIRLQIP